MLSNNYKKYLKYKNKYISLKNKLNGGANCPRIGFHQHSGECWHDAFLMVVLYNDRIGEYLQAIFDSFVDDMEGKIHRHLFDRVFRESPRFLLPYNIPINAVSETELIQIIFDYLDKMAKRYLNDMKPIIKPGERPGLHRQQSEDMSLTCAHNSMKISNINRKEKLVPAKGGSILEMLMNIGVLNYTVFYAFDKLLTTDIFNLVDISSDYYDDCRGNDEDNETVFEDEDIRKANTKLVEHIEQLLRKLTEHNNFLFYLHFHDVKYGHALAFITCNGRPVYYDNNGIDDSNSRPPTDSPFPVNRTTVELDLKQIFIEELTKIKRLFLSATLRLESLKSQLSTFKDKFIVDLISPKVIDRCEVIYPGIIKKYSGVPYFKTLIFFKMEDLKISNLTHYSNPSDYQHMYNTLQNQHYNMTSDLLDYYQEEFYNTKRIAEFKTHVLKGLELTERIVEDEPLEDINRQFTDEEVYYSSESESDDDDMDEDMDDDDMSAEEA